MAIRHSKLHMNQIAATGYTDLWVIPSDVWVTNTTTAHVLDGLDVGDVVRAVLHETKTYIAGPATATVSVGVVGALTQFTAASDCKTAASKYVAAIAAVTPYPNQTAVNLVANAVLGAGAVTAGEVWIWANISRVIERDIQG